MAISTLLWIVPFAVVYLSPVQGVCPVGWEHHADSCYQFVQSEQSWTNAMRHCRRHGATLAVITSQQENEYLRGYLSTNQRYFFGYDMWLGGTDITASRQWEWMNGESMEGFTDWGPGLPDHSGSEDCLEFESEFGNHWNDDYCDELNYFICERPFAPLTPPPPPAGR